MKATPQRTVKAVQAAAVRISANQHHSKLLEAIGNASVVMIGEASHGTHHFYWERAEITKRLIEEKGFNLVIAEADWPDAYRVNRFVRNLKTKDNSVEESLRGFKRFPEWMWKNTVTTQFFQWLTERNDRFADDKLKAGFYGMDLYCLFQSTEEVLKYLEKVSPADARKARRRYSLFDRFQGNENAYGYAAAFGYCKSFEDDVVAILKDLQRKGPEYLEGVGGLIDGDELFYATQNARLVKNAETYYRKTYSPGATTWNIRDKHMSECVENLMNHLSSKGLPPKAVIWAHNSHLGDASATDQGTKRGEWNVGQLLREKFGLEKTFNIGFSTYSGSVTAAPSWGEQAEFMTLRNGLFNSYEHLFHTAAEEMSEKNFMLLLRSNSPNIKIDPLLTKSLSEKRLERYVGVIYCPHTEKASHYSGSNIAAEFDSVIYFDHSSALQPLDPPGSWMSGRDGYKLYPDSFPELNGTLKSAENDFLEERFRCAQYLQNMGDQFIDNQKDLEGAKQMYSKALNYLLFNYILHHGNPQLEQMHKQLLLKKSICNQYLERWNEVIEDCQKVLALEPINVEALCYLARSYAEKARPDLAREVLQKARKIQPSHPEVSKLASVLSEQEKATPFKKGFLTSE